MIHLRLILILLLVALLALTVGGCSGSEDDGAAVESTETETESPEGVQEEEDAPSKSALARGVTAAAGEEDEEPSPEIQLAKLTYEWRVSPKKGLQIRLSFENPHDTYERARGYVVVVAGYTKSNGAVTGVYPWNVELIDGLPSDYSDGAHLLFRRDQEIEGFIPYENTEGYFNSLRLLVYSEDGEKLRDQTYGLDVTGRPTGVQEPKP
ncbi:hypothetical protein KAW64_06790, partial [bacterium]|nr:hypothetical protein [bacterium]